MSNDHLVLSEFLLKKFATEMSGKFPIYQLDIINRQIAVTNCEEANTSWNCYEGNNEKDFSQLESKFATLCKHIVDKIDIDDDAVAKKLNSSRKLIKDWSKASYGRIFFNSPKNISFHINHPYDYRKRNAVIKKVRDEELPKSASEFVDKAYITLFRNSTNANFVLGACHWIENEIDGYGTAFFPISPKLAICLIDNQWRINKSDMLKKNDVAYLNYTKEELVHVFNKVILKHTQEVGLNEIYSATKEELEYLIENTK